MKRTLFLLLLALAAQLRAGSSTSANYTIGTATTDAGGNRASSSAYSNKGSAGGVGGFSAVASPASDNRGGYVGQLYRNVTVANNSADLAADANSFTIQGTNFDPIAANNTVTLSNGATGVVTDATAMSLTITLTTKPTSSGSLTVVVNTDGFSSGNAVQVATLTTSYDLATSSMTEGPAAGSDSVILTVTPESATWTATANDSWLHSSARGTGSGIAVFTFDANPGATRTGTLTIGGQTLTVTQAGSTYVAANPVVALTSGTAGPMAVDAAGNVYFADTQDNTIKKWIAATNTVSTLLSTPVTSAFQVVLDGAGNVYFPTSSGIKKWSASDQSVTTIATGFQPVGWAMDQAGNIYFATSVIKKWTASTNTVSTLVSPPPFPAPTLGSWLALDQSGNVYYTLGDGTFVTVKKWTAATQTSSDVFTDNTPVIFNGQVVAGPNSAGVAVDRSGNVYLMDSLNCFIEKWTAATGSTSILSFGLVTHDSVAVDASGNVYMVSDYNKSIEEIPHAFVDSTAHLEGPMAGSDALSPILPLAENLLSPFAPSSDQGWLTLGSIASGVVNFNFTANTGATRTAHITLLGQSITVTQAGPVIDVQQPAGTHLVDGTSTVDFGSMYMANGAAKIFTIQNTGSSNLTLGTLSIDGANASEFKITANPSTTVAASGSTTFTVTFTPTAVGSRSAALHIPSNDPATGSFDVALQGTGVLESVLPATNVSSGWATLNGTANPNGVSTVAYFRYGTSTNYTANSVVLNLGSGTTPVPVSFNLSGLAKGTTYHYQLVLSSGGKTYFSTDQTFTTPAATSPPAWHSTQVTALANPNASNMADGARTGAAHKSMNLYHYKGTDSNIWCVYWTGAQWSQVQLSNDGNVSDWLSFGTAYNLCCYQGKDGRLWSTYWSGSAWLTVQLGNLPSGVTVAGDIVIDSGWNLVYYRGSNAKMYAVQWNGSAWAHVALSATANVKGNLAVDASSHLIYYQGTDNHLWCEQWTGAVWQQVKLSTTPNVGGAVAADSGGLTVYYRSSADSSAWMVYWNGAVWAQLQLNAGANMNTTSGNFSAIAPYPQRFDTLYLDGNGQGEALYWSGSAWTHVLLGDGAWNLTGGLSYQPSAHWLFARRSDGNVVVFYYQ